MTILNYTTPEGASPTIKPKTRIRCKLVQGVGVNDYAESIKLNGKLIRSYALWCDMLMRCYSADYHEKHPTYAGCSVSKEWHFFSNFEKWFAVNYVEGWHLDKDILLPGNRVYSAATCVFIPQTLNNLLADHRAARGECPMGVCFHKARQKYVANVRTGAGQRYLGIFSTPLEAHRVYQLAKADSIDAAETHDPRIRAALDLRVAQLKNDHANGRITTKL